MAVQNRDQPVTGIDIFHIRIGIIAVFGQNLGPAGDKVTQSLGIVFADALVESVIGIRNRG
jgi:hypothetical protein